jgi:AcrR family transcriptional regulator
MALSRPPLRQRLDSAARRQTILDAAAAVFAEAGYAGARVADIAARVGVTEPVVFQNFGTKAALFAATLDQVSQAYAAQLERLGAEAADAWQALSRLTDPAEFRRLHRPGGAGVLFADAAASGGSPESRRALGRIHGAIVKLVTRGQEQGVIRDDLASADLAWWVLSTFPATAFRHLHTGHRRGDEDALHRLAMEALRAPARKTRTRRG